MIDDKSRAELKYISFDLYGTLFRYDNLSGSWRDWAEVFYVRFVELGLEAQFDEFQSRCQQFFTKDIQQLDDHTVFASRIVQFGEHMGLQVDVEKAHTIADDCCEAWQAHISIHPATKDLLSKLEQEYSLFLVSNFDHPPFVRKMLDHLDISMHFEEVIISGDVGSKKPEREIFEPLRQRYGLDSSNCLHVGDSLDDYHFSINNDLLPLMIGEQGKINGAIDFHLNEIADVDDVMVIEDLSHMYEVLQLQRKVET